MRPISLKQLKEALNEADGVCCYQIETSLDVDNSITMMGINGLVDNSRLKYTEIVTSTNKCPERIADPKGKALLMTPSTYNSPELNKDGVMMLQWADYIGLEITKTGIKNRFKKKHYVRFKNYKNMDDMIEALLPKIRKSLRIQSVF